MLAFVSASGYGLGRAVASSGPLTSLSVKHGDLETLKSFLSLSILRVHGFPVVES